MVSTEAIATKIFDAIRIKIRILVGESLLKCPTSRLFAMCNTHGSPEGNGISIPTYMLLQCNITCM